MGGMFNSDASISILTYTNLHVIKLETEKRKLKKDKIRIYLISNTQIILKVQAI